MSPELKALCRWYARLERPRRELARLEAVIFDDFAGGWSRALSLELDRALLAFEGTTG